MARRVGVDVDPARGACIIWSRGERVVVDLSELEESWRSQALSLLRQRGYTELDTNRFVRVMLTPARAVREAYRLAYFIRQLGVPAISRTF